jgi:transcription initiation factor TFIIA small subunit
MSDATPQRTAKAEPDAGQATTESIRGGKQDANTAANQPGVFYAHYRASTIGLTLEDTLDELLSAGHLQESEAALVWTQFDQAVARYLRRKVRQRSVLRGRLAHYNLRDNVWTFLVRHALLRLERKPETYAAVERLPRASDLGSATDASIRVEPAVPASGSLKLVGPRLASHLPPRPDCLDGRAVPAVTSHARSAGDATTEAYVYADRLRLICTAADANIVKATSGSSRRKRSAAPLRFRPRSRPASSASAEE